MQLTNTCKRLISNNPLASKPLLLFLTLLFSIPATQAWGQLNTDQPEKLQQAGVDEQLGSIIPGEITFKDSNGATITVAEIFEGDKPVLVNPVYYECPMLCSLVLNGVLEGAQNVAWSPGKDYKILTFSIDDEETPELAARNKSNYLSNLDRPGADEGWYFLTGDSTSIHTLAEAIGFNFAYDPKSDEYAHAAAIVFASPERKITRYLYGIEYSELNMKNALYEAADGKIGNPLDQIVMYCYQYDPDSRSYVPVAWNIMQIGGLATFLILAIFLGLFWLREKGNNPKYSA